MSLVDKSNYIDAVPPEIWERIFLQAIQPPNRRSVCDPHDALSQLHLGFSLSQTCGRWRDIALEKPFLWNTMVVHYHGDKQTPNQHLVQLMIERSANTPLSLDLRLIDVDDNMFVDPTSAAYRSMDILLGSLPRWQDLRLYLHDGSTLPRAMIQRLEDIGAASLERLHLDAELVSSTSDALFTRLWERSPRLHKIFLSRSNYPGWDHPETLTYVGQVPKRLPISQITSLYVHTSLGVKCCESISATVVVEILHGAPNLVSCVFTNLNIYTGCSVFTMKRSIHMPRLEYLHLACRAYERIGYMHFPLTGILDYIMAPSLTVIAFTNIQKWNQDEFESFILRSECSLKEIHFLNPTDLGPERLIPILRSLPSLQGIHIGCIQDLLDEPSFRTDMMAWNTQRREFEICPELSWISFRDPTSFDIQEPKYDLNPSGVANFAKILKRRLDPPNGGKRTFERIYVPADKLLTDAYNDIRALCSDPYGLDVRADDGGMYEIYDVWERYGDK